MGLSFPMRLMCSYTYFTSRGVSPTGPQSSWLELKLNIWLLGLVDWLLLPVRNHGSVPKRIEMNYNPSCAFVLANSA